MRSPDDFQIGDGIVPREVIRRLVGATVEADNVWFLPTNDASPCTRVASLASNVWALGR